MVEHQQPPASDTPPLSFIENLTVVHDNVPLLSRAWDSTAPTSTLLTSVPMMNGRSGSGYVSTGAPVNASLG